ncbi:hypothetical protein [Tumebacillus flagellatus]|uniref:Uncharacterized protein n=1 Tax=Tumebacillus flagellatus TaxID=1157490 RepID=A0A074MHJ6_9BACL|nr:hypothetical protein [Tumebacillus flagellatus]KEO85127.1 hypothetical protein EL26_00780 [Tumebacillus flagellatus]
MRMTGRRLKAYLNPYTVNPIHPRNPWISLWWSASFPGLGHMALCRYVKGVILMLWELFINVHAHLNDAVLYSLTGQYALAKQVLDPRWFGFLLDWMVVRPRRKNHRKSAITTELFLLVHFQAHLEDKVRQTLWSNSALGLAKLDRPTPEKRA